MFETVREIIAEQLDINISEITMESRFDEDLEADSFEIMELVVQIEDRYNITVADEDLEKIATVGDVVNMLEKMV
ncbi:MAG: acyl carrier protein [Anaerofustis stercorihominis]|nr:acyl carrier protein [Anaerofustis stercorihominis]